MIFNGLRLSVNAKFKDTTDEKKSFDEGFESGKVTGHQEGYEEGHQVGFADGYADGQQAERNIFWDAYQSAKQSTWMYLFGGSCWGDANFYPKYDIKPTGDATGLFRYAEITDLAGRLKECGVALDTNDATRLQYLFHNSKVTKVPTIDITKCTNTGALFASCDGLTSIEKLIVSESTPYGSMMFDYVPNLEHLIIEGTIGQNGFALPSAVKLSHDSLMSIINALADYSESTSTWTVTLGATNLAKLTDVEKAIATEKGWTLA